MDLEVLLRRQNSSIISLHSHLQSLCVGSMGHDVMYLCMHLDACLSTALYKMMALWFSLYWLSLGSCSKMTLSWSSCLGFMFHRQLSLQEVKLTCHSKSPDYNMYCKKMFPLSLPQPLHHKLLWYTSMINEPSVFYIAIKPPVWTQIGRILLERYNLLFHLL